MWFGLFAKKGSMDLDLLVLKLWIVLATTDASDASVSLAMICMALINVCLEYLTARAIQSSHAPKLSPNQAGRVDW